MLVKAESGRKAFARRLKDMAEKKNIADLFDATKWGVDFSRSEAECVAQYLSVSFHKAGDFVFRENDRNNYMAFLIEGEVDIRKDRDDSLEQSIITLRPGTHFGEMALVDGEPRSASVKVRKDATLLILSEANFERILVENPQIGIKMLRKIAYLLSRRLRQTTGRLAYMRI